MEELPKDMIRAIGEFGSGITMKRVSKKWDEAIEIKNLTELTVDLHELIGEIEDGDLAQLEKLFTCNRLKALTFKPYYSEVGNDIHAYVGHIIEPREHSEKLRKVVEKFKHNMKYYYIIHVLILHNQETLRYLNMNDILFEDDILLCENLKQFDFILPIDFGLNAPDGKQLTVCYRLNQRGCITPIFDIDRPGKYFVKANYYGTWTFINDGFSVYQYCYYHPDERKFLGDDYFHLEPDPEIDGWAPGDRYGVVNTDPYDPLDNRDLTQVYPRGRCVDGKVVGRRIRPGIRCFPRPKIRDDEMDGNPLVDIAITPDYGIPAEEKYDVIVYALDCAHPGTHRIRPPLPMPIIEHLPTITAAAHQCRKLYIPFYAYQDWPVTTPKPGNVFPFWEAKFRYGYYDLYDKRGRILESLEL